MLVELLVESKEALQVALLGLDRRRGLSGDLSDEVYISHHVKILVTYMDSGNRKESSGSFAGTL
jgi:hypothetical protein